MVGAGAARVKAALALAVIAGCFWRSYGRLAATHVDLLTAIARKGADLIASGRLTAESMPELTYPLERAQAFAREARARSGDKPPPSLDAFDAFLARYRAFLDTLDRIRREQTGEAARTALSNPLTELETAGDQVRAALQAEGKL